MSDQSDDSMDPADIYTLEEFVAEQTVLDSFGRQIEQKIKSKSGAGPSRRRNGPRRYINRNREEAHEQLVADYFAADPLYTDAMFRRRFRMRRHVFLRIVSALGEWSPYFTQRVDCTNRMGLSPLQKCTAAIRMLAYGTSADNLDEYLKVAEECIDLNHTASTSIVLPPEAKLGTNSNPCFDDVRRRNAAIRARPIHTQLKKDLIEHIWHCFGNMHN